jgi:acyl carrier protein
MEQSQVLEDINKVFIKVLGNKNIKLTLNTVAAEVEDWDSLNHIQLVVAVEKHFGIRFTSAEIQNWKNVGNMCESVMKRTAAK